MQELTQEERNRLYERFKKRAATHTVYMAPVWVFGRITDFIDNQMYLPEGWDEC